MKKFLKFITKAIALAGLVTGAAYAVKKLFIDNGDDEFVDDYTDLDYELDGDLQPVTEREYVSITPDASPLEKAAEKVEEVKEDVGEKVGDAVGEKVGEKVEEKVSDKVEEKITGEDK
ncbi:MAG TPA: hypothetical protein H9887_00430 [Candidatus Dorea intestinavium]|nr:hypothetical protein [Candidatus Dorea intestinavium]